VIIGQEAGMNNDKNSQFFWVSFSEFKPGQESSLPFGRRGETCETPMFPSCLSIGSEQHTTSISVHRQGEHLHRTLPSSPTIVGKEIRISSLTRKRFASGTMVTRSASSLDHSARPLILLASCVKSLSCSKTFQTQ